MNKALHVFVYLFLIGVGVAIWYEYQLNDKRSELYARNKLMENYLVEKLTPLIEDGSDYAPEVPPEAPKIELDRDKDPRVYPVSEPALENVLLDNDMSAYDFVLESQDHQVLHWGDPERRALRDIVKLDAEGKQILDGGNWSTTDTKADKLLASLVETIRRQKDQFAKTRAAIPPLRQKLAEVVELYNELTPKVREDAETIHTQKGEIETLTSEKKKLLEKEAEYQNEIEENKRTIETLNQDVEKATQETAEAKEELEKQVKLVETLKLRIRELQEEQRNLLNNRGGNGGLGGGTVVGTLPFGDKGRIISVNNEILSAVVEFTPEAMKQLKGDDLTRPMPVAEFPVKRLASPDDKEGTLVGRIRIRQEIPGKNWVLCEILANWSQGDLEPGDIIFAN